MGFKKLTLSFHSQGLLYRPVSGLELRRRRRWVGAAPPASRCSTHAALRVQISQPCDTSLIVNKAGNEDHGGCGGLRMAVAAPRTGDGKTAVLAERAAGTARAGGSPRGASVACQNVASLRIACLWEAACASVRPNSIATDRHGHLARYGQADSCITT